MDLAKVLIELHEELANLDAAILSLERLQEGGRRRGRPPAWLAEVKKTERTVRKHRGQVEGQAAGRK
jgi:ATP/maltotriose-dependent transcriptional regulator MalT